MVRKSRKLQQLKNLSHISQAPKDQMTHSHSRTVWFTLGVLVACGSCDQHVREGELAAAINFAEVVSVNGFEVVNAGLFEVFGTNRPTLTNPTPGQEHLNAPGLVWGWLELVYLCRILRTVRH